MIQITEAQYRKYQLYETYLYNLLSEKQIRLSLIEDDLKRTTHPIEKAGVHIVKERIKTDIKQLQSLLVEGKLNERNGDNA